MTALRRVLGVVVLGAFLLAPGTAIAATQGGQLRTHDHSNANQGGSTLRPVTLVAGTLVATTYSCTSCTATNLNIWQDARVRDDLTVDDLTTVSTVTASGTINSTSGGHNSLVGSLSVGTATDNDFGVNIATTVHYSSGTAFAGLTTAPNGIAGKGVIYFDGNTNVFMVKENNGTAKPIVDPPGNWTCTIRTGSTSSSCPGINNEITSTASCTGTEKVLDHGCRLGGSVASDIGLSDTVTNQGVTCSVWCAGATARTVTATANCCQ